MEFYINIISYILLAFALSFFIAGFKQRKNMRAEFFKKSEAIKLKEVEFNELRLLAAGVTHEINNALMVIMVRLSQMLKKNQYPDQEKVLNVLLKTSERIAASVLAFRKVLYPDNAEKEEFIDLSDLMDNVFKLIGQRLRNHGIELKLKGIEYKVIKGRKGQLEQLVVNLINQSIERLTNLQDKWIQIIATEESGKLNIYFMDSSGEVGDKIDHKQFSDILESNHGHLTVNQNNLILELTQAPMERYHY
jgi:C4-dicarboxylate-specific signal transduction histidine kinase